MNRWCRPLMCWMTVMAFAGCAGTGEVIPLQIHPNVTKAKTMSAATTPLRVSVDSIDDARSHQTGLGVRTHLWGGVSYFDVPGGKPADAATHALADYLTSKGWQVVRSDDSARDIIVTGKLLDCSVHAKSGFGFTALTARTKLALQARNVADGSIVRMTLNGSGSDNVFWFDPDDAQTLVNDVMTSSFDKVVADTRVEGRSLRLKHVVE